MNYSKGDYASPQLFNMAAAQLTKVFNAQLMAFIEDVIALFPDNTAIKHAREYIIMAKGAKPRMIIELWFPYVCVPYFPEIEAGNLTFFLNKDYAADLAAGGAVDGNTQNKVLDMIETGLRGPMRSLSEGNQAKCIKYLQNLCKLANEFKQYSALAK